MTKTDAEADAVLTAYDKPASSEWTPADELARGIVKKGRKAKGADGEVVESLTFWRIVDRAQARDAQAIALIHEYAAATFNRDALVKPVKLMEEYGVLEPDAAITDDGAADAADPVILVCTLDPESWRYFRRTCSIAPVGAILLKVREIKERADPEQWEMHMMQAMLELGWRRIMPGEDILIFDDPEKKRLTDANRADY
jgi:hypothetical protein